MALNFPSKDLTLPENSISEINESNDKVTQSNSYSEIQYGGIKASQGTGTYIDENSLRMATWNCKFCENHVDVIEGVSEYTVGDRLYSGLASSNYLNNNMAVCTSTVTRGESNTCVQSVSWAMTYFIARQNLCGNQCLRCYDYCNNGCFNVGCFSCTASCDADNCLTSCNTDCQTSCAQSCQTICQSCTTGCAGGCTSCAGPGA